MARAGVSEAVWNGESESERRSSLKENTSRKSRDGLEDITWLDDDPDGIPVYWEEGDVENPMNFAKRRKWMNAMILAFACFMVSIASSGFSQGISKSSEDREEEDR